jgi:Domain of unknown function (DUF6487)
MPGPCPKCGGGMEEGFLPDRTHRGVTPASWVAGAPEKSFWSGLRLKGRAQIPLTTWRCRKCGYLESYATGG